MELQEMQQRLGAAAEDCAPQQEIIFKPMFGGVCAYVAGRVFASISNVGMALKLSVEAQDELLKSGGKRLQHEPDAPISKQYIVVPEAIARTDLSAWVGRSLAFVLSQPAPKARKKRAA